MKNVLRVGGIHSKVQQTLAMSGEPSKLLSEITWSKRLSRSISAGMGSRVGKNQVKQMRVL